MENRPEIKPFERWGASLMKPNCASRLGLWVFDAGEGKRKGLALLCFCFGLGSRADRMWTREKRSESG